MVDKTKYTNYTFIDAVFACGHADFQLAMPHNGELTEAEYNASYREVIAKNGGPQNDMAVFSTNVADFTVKYAAAKAKYDELTAAEDLTNVRKERTLLLEKTDWTVLSDTPLSASKVTEWKTYRQALRDIPTTCTSLEDVVWPTKPS